MDSRKKTYKSHVLLVRQLMKPYQFRTEDGKKVNFLDLKANAIKQEKIKNLDAEEMYFDRETEDFLGQCVETPFSDSVKKIQNSIKNGTQDITLADLKNIRRFFQYSLLRNKEAYKKIFDISIFSSITTGFSHSFALSFTPATDKVFVDKKVRILLNKNKNGLGYVCPNNVVYYFHDSTVNDYCLAITVNRYMIVCLYLSITSNNLEIIECEDDMLIKSINCGAYITAKKHGLNYIVGNEEDLIRLMSDINEFEENKKTSMSIKLK